MVTFEVVVVDLLVFEVLVAVAVLEVVVIANVLVVEGAAIGGCGCCGSVDSCYRNRDSGGVMRWL